MKKNIIIFVLLILLAVAFWHLLRGRSERDQTGSSIEMAAKETVKIEVEKLIRKVDEKGIETVIIEETDHVMKHAGIKPAADSARIIDSLQRLANNRLMSYTQARAEIKRLKQVMEETDTTFTFRDKWLTVEVAKPANGHPALLTSSYNAELNWMWYRDRKHFFAPLRTYGRFWLNDPNATITGLKHIRIEPPRQRFGVDLLAVGEYFRGEALIGGGVSVNIGRFRIQGNYLYDGHSWHPAVRGGVKLVDW